MHIVQILPELNDGGVERGVIDLNRELCKLNYKSTVITKGGKHVDQISNDGGQIIFFDVSSKNPLSFYLRVFLLKKLLTSLNPDILHARSRIPAWLAWKANKKLKIPFITTVHGFNSINRYSSIMTKGDLVIYASHAINDYVIKNFKINKNKLRYVPRGIDTEFFNPEKVDKEWIENFKKNYQLQKKRIISIVGRITKWKGHDDFIHAIAKSQKSDPSIIGLIVGDASSNNKVYFESLKKLTLELGANIIFVGSQKKMREIYTISNLVVSASSDKPETFGRTIAESLSMNTPVIASNHGGAKDIIIDQKNGLLFEPKNKNELAKLINESKTYLFENMRSHIQKKFSLTIMTDLETSVYQEALKLNVK